MILGYILQVRNYRVIWYTYAYVYIMRSFNALLPCFKVMFSVQNCSWSWLTCDCRSTLGAQLIARAGMVLQLFISRDHYYDTGYIKKNATSEFPKKSLRHKRFYAPGNWNRIANRSYYCCCALNKCINFALCTRVCNNFDSCAILNSYAPKIFCLWNHVDFLGNSEVAFFLYTLYRMPVHFDTSHLL
jgi:hypothetical protein